MFSGIVEQTALLLHIEQEENSQNVHLTFTTSFWDELKIDQSIAHNGVCLTVVSIDPSQKSYTVTAIQETLLKSNLGSLKVGDEVNLERSMPIGGRLDGHIVQGHVDTTAKCISVTPADGSTYFTFEYTVSPEMAKKGYVTVEKGSVCVNGVSLTVVGSELDSFSVAIIPYTIEHTNFKSLEVGMPVNIEFDIIGKYLARRMEVQELLR